ncbi:hypothetical protein ABTI34_17765 [Acinetobacter baumannii]|jgi:hypothetical protein
MASSYENEPTPARERRILSRRFAPNPKSLPKIDARICQISHLAYVMFRLQQLDGLSVFLERDVVEAFYRNINAEFTVCKAKALK